MTTAVNAQFLVGDETMRRVFRPARLCNLHDMQAVLDAVEIALVNSENAEGGQNSEAATRLKLTEQAFQQNGYHSGSIHDRIQLICHELKEAQDKLDESASWPEWATKCLKIIRTNTGADGYDDATEGVDLPGELEEVLASLEEENAKLGEKVKELDAKLETANALVVCVCGSGVDQHGMGDGHSPVSSYHHSYSQAVERIAELEKQVANASALNEKSLSPYVRTLAEAEKKIRELTDERDELKFRMDGLEK